MIFQTVRRLRNGHYPDIVVSIAFFTGFFPFFCVWAKATAQHVNETQQVNAGVSLKVFNGGETPASRIGIFIENEYWVSIIKQALLRQPCRNIQYAHRQCSIFNNLILPRSPSCLYITTSLAVFLPAISGSHRWLAIPLLFLCGIQ